MIYAVILLLDDHGSIEAIVQKVDQEAYISYSPKIYFVSFNGTADALSKQLGFTSQSHQKEGMVIAIRKFGDYFGYANGDLWPWMQDRVAK